MSGFYHYEIVLGLLYYIILIFSCDLHRTFMNVCCLHRYLGGSFTSTFQVYTFIVWFIVFQCVKITYLKCFVIDYLFFQMTDEHYNLKWNNHQPNFISVFQSLLQLEELVDVTLSVEGKHIKAHKIILSACSPYFKVSLLRLIPHYLQPNLFYFILVFQSKANLYNLGLHTFIFNFQQRPQ